jgi:hypothetical protein
MPVRGVAWFGLTLLLLANHLSTTYLEKKFDAEDNIMMIQEGNIYSAIVSNPQILNNN